MTLQGNLFGVDGGVVFSADRRYRYLLSRPGPRPVTFLMLNPSTADEVNDDPTIRRCRGYSRDWGFDGVIIANAFAWRSTDPNALYDLADPVGPDNDMWILEAASRAVGPIVCGWGKHGKLHGRGAAVAALLRAHGHRPMTFGLNLDGSPKHPLYLRADLQLQEMP
jgi:hypothetical protein